MTDPFLIYHDEISLGNMAPSGILVCRVESSSPVWRDVAAVGITSSTSPYQSTVSGSEGRLSRNTTSIPNDDTLNGLWSCVQQDLGAFAFIGIYNQGM